MHNLKSDTLDDAYGDVKEYIKKEIATYEENKGDEYYKDLNELLRKINVAQHTSTELCIFANQRDATRCKELYPNVKVTVVPNSFINDDTVYIMPVEEDRVVKFVYENEM